MLKISGQVLDFDLGGVVRKYIIGANRFAHLEGHIISNAFDVTTGLGEQRSIIERHKNDIKRAMRKKNSYTPTAFAFGTYESHRQVMDITDGVVTLEVDTDNPLPLLDGGHRHEALTEIRSEGGVLEKKVDNTFIPYLLYLDGDLRQDFINHQAGRPVSRDHMLSIKLASGLIDKNHAPYLELAQKAAMILHTTGDSFCHNIVQFDATTAKLPLSSSSLCTKNASDLAFSLYGGAKLAIHHKKDAQWLSECILTAYRAIKLNNKTKDFLSKGNLLTPIPDGTKAGTSIIIGIGNMLAARLMLKQIDEPEVEDIAKIIDCVYNNLDYPVRGNTSADRKRSVFKQFVVELFSDMVSTPETNLDFDEEGADIPIRIIGAHEGIPVAIIRLLSSSTFDVSKLPSETKKRGRPKKMVSVAENKIKEIENDNDNDNEVDIHIDTAIVDDEDPVDAEAFADMDDQSEANLALVTVTSAPWDDDLDEVL